MFSMSSNRLIHLLILIIFLLVFYLLIRQSFIPSSTSIKLPSTLSSYLSPSVQSNLIIYNRVPKTGSTSFMGIAYDLCTVNHFYVLHLNTSKNTHILSLSDQIYFTSNITSWSSKKPAIYHGHLSFLDFTKFGLPNPIYINIIREPLDRLVSHYYFLRFGDDFLPNKIRKRQGNKETFDQCVARKGRDCAPELMWLQIPFFCGHAKDCWMPGNRWALEQAKNNLISHYFLVGVTEQLKEFIMLLETSLPNFFRGATKLFETGKKSHLRRTNYKMSPIPETIEKIQSSKIWKMEKEFYDFALQQFNFIKERSLKKGRQFFFEKIRPKYF